MSELISIYRAPEPSGDVVFVHGLGGDPIKTWGSTDKVLGNNGYRRTVPT